MNPASIPPPDLARLLSLAPEVIDRHLDEGAPTNGDGTMNLVHYAAWLNVSDPPTQEATIGH
jgi:hypothetical protein